MDGEAELAGAQIALGVNALGRADHARIGDYAVAFFSLAIGLERLGKLIFIADHSIEHHGMFTNNDDLKRTISHDLALLLDQCQHVRAHADKIPADSREKYSPQLSTQEKQKSGTVFL